LHVENSLEKNKEIKEC